MSFANWKKSLKLRFYHAPKFWDNNNFWAKLLSPAAKIYAAQTAKRMQKTGYKAKVPVICVGNLVVGGGGKTPVAIYLAKQLMAQNKKVHFLASGYGGSAYGIEPAQKVLAHDCKKFGDEAVLLAKTAPTWVGKNRAEAAKLAEADGAEILLMDDGYQNADLYKDFSLLVIDGEYGFGNGRVLPAGPLREPVADGLARADAVIVIGEERADLPEFAQPKFAANVKIYFDEFLRNDEVVAFCGIARPEKFFNSLQRAGLKLVETISFPDHFLYAEADLKGILGVAEQYGAVVVTTEKDYVKIPEMLHMMLHLVKAEIEIFAAQDLLKLIAKK